MISDAWDALRSALKRAFMVTIFGYNAPTSDVTASNILREAWDDPEKTKLEQFEIIDILPENELREKWKDFINKDYYDVHSNIFSSWMLLHLRRPGEAFWNQYIEAKFIVDNPIPQDKSLSELRNWVEPLLEAERSSNLS